MTKQHPLFILGVGLLLVASILLIGQLLLTGADDTGSVVLSRFRLTPDSCGILVPFKAGETGHAEIAVGQGVNRLPVAGSPVTITVEPSDGFLIDGKPQAKLVAATGVSGVLNFTVQPTKTGVFNLTAKTSSGNQLILPVTALAEKTACADTLDIAKIVAAEQKQIEEMAAKPASAALKIASFALVDSDGQVQAGNRVTAAVKVIDAQGQPAAGVSVTIRPSLLTGEKEQWADEYMPDATTVVTNSQGIAQSPATIGQMPAGTFTLTASVGDLNAAPVILTVTVKPGSLAKSPPGTPLVKLAGVLPPVLNTPGHDLVFTTANLAATNFLYAIRHLKPDAAKQTWKPEEAILCVDNAPYFRPAFLAATDSVVGAAGGTVANEGETLSAITNWKSSGGAARVPAPEIVYKNSGGRDKYFLFALGENSQGKTACAQMAMAEIELPALPKVNSAGTTYLEGDVTGDGKVTAADATMALRIAIGKVVLSADPAKPETALEAARQRLAADTVPDYRTGGLERLYRIDVADATRILQAAIGKIQLNPNPKAISGT